MPELAIFNREAIEQLRRDHQRLEMQINNLSSRLRAFTNELTDDIKVYIGQNGGSQIAARSGTTVSSGTVTVYKQTGGTINSVSQTVTAFNLSTDAVAANAYVNVAMDRYGTYWVLVGGAGTSYKKHLCRFTAGGNFGITSASVTGTITAQIGEGDSHTTTTGVTFNNLETGSAGTYVFEGGSGDAGLAYFSSGTTWQIIQMECP